MYILIIILAVMISVVKDKKDPDYFIKEADSNWLVHPLYSLMCGPYSTFFPRIARSLNIC